MKKAVRHRKIRQPEVRTLTRTLSRREPISIVMVCLVLLLFAAASRISFAAETPRAQPDTPNVPDDNMEWRFRVYLDDKVIGYHDFIVNRIGTEQVVTSVADFEYRLLFVKLYDYRHENSESWQGNCLQRIESSTNANGEPFAVTGQARTGDFVVRSNGGAEVLPGCVMTFAYWNPRFLQQRQLLNSQNGEYLQVETSGPIRDRIQVRGAEQEAWRYRLSAGPLDLALWYSSDQQWLGLESTTESGRVLRYELL